MINTCSLHSCRVLHIPPHCIHSLEINLLGITFKKISLAKYLGSIRNRASNKVDISTPVWISGLQFAWMLARSSCQICYYGKIIPHRSEWQKTLRPFVLNCAFKEDYLLRLYGDTTPVLNPVHYRNLGHWCPEDWIANIYIMVIWKL